MSNRIVRPTSGPVRRGKFRDVLTGVAAAAAGGGGGGSAGITELTGDVTAGPGSGAQAATIGANKVTTTKIADAAVTMAKLADLAGLSVIGRSANSTGVPAAITAANDGEVLRRSGAALGFGTVAAAGLAANAVTTPKILDANVTLAKLEDLAALSVLGRAANSAGVMAAIAAANDLEVLRRSGTSIGFGRVAYGGIQDVSATSKILGRKTAGAGIIEELSVSDVLTLLGFVNAGGSIYTGSGHPQGVVSAPIGNMYIDTATGYQYRKIGGGSTAYGWYYVFPGAGLGGPMAWSSIPTGFGAATTVAGRQSSYGYFASSIGDGVAEMISDGTLGTVSRFYSNNKIYANLLSGSTINTTWGYHHNTSVFLQTLDGDIDIWIDMMTGSDVTNIRIWFGLTSATISTDTDTIGSVSNGAIMFRYSTGAGDGGWVGYTCSGAGGNGVTATVASIAASTAYRLRIRFIRSGTPTVYFSVNDGTEVSRTANIPATGNTHFPAFGFTIKAASARTLRFNSWGASVGS